MWKHDSMAGCKYSNKLSLKINQLQQFCSQFAAPPLQMSTQLPPNQMLL